MTDSSIAKNDRMKMDISATEPNLDTILTSALTVADLDDLVSVNPDGYLFANLLDKLMTRTGLSAAVLIRQREMYLNGVSRLNVAAERVALFGEDKWIDTLIAAEHTRGRGE